MKGWVVGKTENGKMKLILTGYDVQTLEKTPDGRWIENTSARRIDSVDTLDHPLTIPCGKCLECCLAYARNWAARCMMEASLHESNYFLTLTYDDEHLPGAVVTEDGEIITPAFSSLCKKDFQDFMKRLRKDTGQKLRYFAAGEYGSKGKRPHYHAIVFGLSLDDLVAYSKNFRGDTLYKSATLEKIWGKGFVTVGECNYDTACYTARYVVKKATGEDGAALSDFGFENEFVLMSRRPGIAKEFYELHKDDFAKYGCVYLPTKDGSIKIQSPRYFKGFLEVDCPEDYFGLKEMSEAAADAGIDRLLSLSSKDYLAMCKDREEFKKVKVKVLERSL